MGPVERSSGSVRVRRRGGAGQQATPQCLFEADCIDRRIDCAT
jgi:hypothetical protein